MVSGVLPPVERKPLWLAGILSPLTMFTRHEKDAEKYMRISREFYLFFLCFYAPTYAGLKIHVYYVCVFAKPIDFKGKILHIVPGSDKLKQLVLSLCPVSFMPPESLQVFNSYSVTCVWRE